MPNVYRTVVFATGTRLYVPPPNLINAEVIVRAGGGGGASGMHSRDSENCLGGPGGGGGGLSFTPRPIRRDELPDSIEVRVGSGGSGGYPSSNSWATGSNGGDSWFGDILFAGGGGGGGRIYNENGTWTASITAGGRGGYGMCRGGRGLHHRDVLGSGWFLNWTPARFSPADSFNEVIMPAGGGGGGHGSGWTGDWEDIRDEDGEPTGEYEWVQSNHSEKHGGSSGAVEADRTAGAAGKGTLPMWETLQSGCGGNGAKSEGSSGGRGGFPSGGGAGGTGSDSFAGSGGSGGSGSVTIIEYLTEE